jgi:hypothetical protein
MKRGEQVEDKMKIKVNIMNTKKKKSMFHMGIRMRAPHILLGVWTHQRQSNSLTLIFPYYIIIVVTVIEEHRILRSTY